MYLTPIGPLRIQAALGDAEATKDMLRACLADEAPPLLLRALSGPDLDAMRSDPEIDQLLDTLYDGARPKTRP